MRITDNVKGRPLGVRMDANNAGFVQAINAASTAVGKQTPVIVSFDKNGWTYYESTYAAFTAPGTRFMGIAQVATTASAGGTYDVQILGPGLMLSSSTSAAGSCIVRSTGATVDLCSTAVYSGLVGQWAIVNTTVVTTDVAHYVMLPGLPLFYATTHAMST